MMAPATILAVSPKLIPLLWASTFGVAQWSAHVNDDAGMTVRVLAVARLRVVFSRLIMSHPGTCRFAWRCAKYNLSKCNGVCVCRMSGGKRGKLPDANAMGPKITARAPHGDRTQKPPASLHFGFQAPTIVTGSS